MMAKVTWLGDEDPTAQVVELYGHTFVKGEAVTVSDKDANLEKLKGNSAFSFDGKGEVVSAIEPEQPDPEAGTELEALKKELDARHIKYRANASPETLRGLLAKGAAE